MREDIDPLALANQICFATYAASHAFSRRYKALLADLGLTYPQYICLLVLWQADDLTVKEIGEKLSLDSGTLTPLLKRLEAMMLLKRTRDAKDERMVRITLTQRGRDLRLKAQSIPPALMRATGHSLDELIALKDQLTRLRDALLVDEEAPKATG